MSTLFVDTINEKTTNNGVYIPGHVLQAVTGTLSSGISTTSGTMAATALKATITPSTTSSKIYVVASMAIQNGSANGGTNIELYRKIGSATAASILKYGSVGLQQYSAGGNNISVGHYSYLDSPSTTSAIEYEIYYSRYSTGTSYLLSNPQIIAMEIGA